MSDQRTFPVWDCKIGVRGTVNLPSGADWPIRRAVEAAFKEITGVDAEFCFSGWGGTLTEGELAVVENRIAHATPKSSEGTLLDEAVEVMGKALQAINAAYAQADAEMRDHDRIAARHEVIVRDGRNAIRAFLVKAGGDRA